MVEAREGLPARDEERMKRREDLIRGMREELVKGPPEVSEPEVREAEKERVQTMTRRDFIIWLRILATTGAGVYLGFFKRDLLGKILSIPKETIDTISPKREGRGELGGQWVEQAEVRRLYLLESRQAMMDAAAYIAKEAAARKVNINDKSTWSKELVEYFTGVDKFYQDLMTKEGRDRLRTLSEKWAPPKGIVPDRRDELKAFEDFLENKKDEPSLDILHSYLRERKGYQPADIEILDIILLPEKRTNLKETLNAYNAENKNVPQLK